MLRPSVVADPIVERGALEAEGRSEVIDLSQAHAREQHVRGQVVTDAGDQYGEVLDGEGLNLQVLPEAGVAHCQFRCLVQKLVAPECTGFALASDLNEQQ